MPEEQKLGLSPLEFCILLQQDPTSTGWTDFGACRQLSGRDLQTSIHLDKPTFVILVLRRLDPPRLPTGLTDFGAMSLVGVESLLCPFSSSAAQTARAWCEVTVCWPSCPLLFSTSTCSTDSGAHVTCGSRETSGLRLHPTGERCTDRQLGFTGRVLLVGFGSGLQKRAEIIDSTDFGAMSRFPPFAFFVWTASHNHLVTHSEAFIGICSITWYPRFVFGAVGGRQALQFIEDRFFSCCVYWQEKHVFLGSLFEGVFPACMTTGFSAC